MCAGSVITYDILTGWNPIQLYDQFVTSIIVSGYSCWAGLTWTAAVTVVSVSPGGQALALKVDCSSDCVVSVSPGGQALALKVDFSSDCCQCLTWGSGFSAKGRLQQ